MADKPLTYDKAYAELEQIMNDLQADRIGVDELTVKVKRAVELITLQKNKQFQPPPATSTALPSATCKPGALAVSLPIVGRDVMRCIVNLVCTHAVNTFTIEA